MAHCGKVWQKGAPKGNQNARKHRLFASYVPMVVLEEALNLPPGDLRLEIALVRGILADLVRTGQPIPELVKSVDTATNALSRLLRTNQKLAADQPNEFDAAVAQVLEKLGLA